MPMSDAFEVLNDAKWLLIVAFNYLSQGRKESVRASVRDGRFFKLCAWETPVGQDQLFGDLSKQLADIDTAGKLSSGIRSRRQFQSPQTSNRKYGRGGYKHQRHNYRESRDSPYKKPKPFLEKGKGKKSKKKD